MNELDEMWSAMLAQASEKARASDRHDVADYLDLKASNDMIRRASVQWLFDTLIQHAAATNRANTAVTIERAEPHSFSHRGANLVGSVLSFRYGVRCLTVEAGWTRTPSDGFLRGGALAFARFRHFGMPKANIEVALFGSEKSPVWKVFSDNGAGPDIHSDDLKGHIALLIQG